MNKPKIDIIKQGKTVIEEDADGFLIMHPDGTIEGCVRKDTAEKIAKEWYQENLGGGLKIGIGEIEWKLTKE